MTRDELLAFFDSEIKDCRTILEMRNKLYAQDTDALFNIRKLNVDGILIQIREKCTRIENMANLRTDDIQTVEVAIHDSCVDIINYSFLLECLIKFA